MRYLNDKGPGKREGGNRKCRRRGTPDVESPEVKEDRRTGQDDSPTAPHHSVRCLSDKENL